MPTRVLSWIMFALVAASGCATGAPPATTPAPVAAAKRAPIPAAEAEPELVAIDIFGTRQITLEQVLATCGDELRAYGEAGMRRTPGGPSTEAVLARLHGLGDFAEISPALVGYYEDDGMKYYLTFDFVDRSDVARRMPFSPEPTGTYPDPEGLIADWYAYDAKVSELMVARQMSPRRVECPAFHCIGDHAHAEVKQLADRFIARAPAHVAELATILRDDHDGSRRAAAAYLLAYSKDGPALVKLIVPAFRDHSSYVRNSAMRVIADIAFYHPELEVPLEPVLEALNYPATTDRNKAAAILDGLLAQPGAAARHLEIARRAGTTLVAMLRLQQPNNHGFAYSILKALSGKDLGERNHAAWEAWLRDFVGAGVGFGNDG